MLVIEFIKLEKNPKDCFVHNKIIFINCNINVFLLLSKNPKKNKWYKINFFFSLHKSIISTWLSISVPSSAVVVLYSFAVVVKMGAASSSFSELPTNDYLKKLAGTEPLSSIDPFWNQLLSFSFLSPISR